MEQAANLSAAEEFQSFVNVLTYCYVLPLICLLGFVGNMANLATLATPKLSAVSYIYLRGLAVADMACMSATFVFCLCEIAKHNKFEVTRTYGFAWFFAHLILPAINVPLNVGNFMVLALTLERYLSVCFPIWFRGINSPRRASVAIVCSVALVSIIHVPQLWRMSVYCDAHCPQGNASNASAEAPEWSPRASALFKTTLFKSYKWVRETMCKFVPIVLIAFMNVGIIVAFRRHKELRQRLTNKAANGVGPTTASQRDNRSLLYLLLGIVVLFFICKIPAAVNLIFISDANKRKMWFAKFRAMANLLEISNSALNFYVFCLCSQDYRSIFLQKFPCLGRLLRRLRGALSCLRSGLRRLSQRPSSSVEASADAPALPPIREESEGEPAPNRREVMEVISEASERISEIQALLQASDGEEPSPAPLRRVAPRSASHNGVLGTREEEEEIFL